MMLHGAANKLPLTIIIWDTVYINFRYKHHMKLQNKVIPVKLVIFPTVAWVEHADLVYYVTSSCPFCLGLGDTIKYDIIIPYT